MNSRITALSTAALFVFSFAFSAPSFPFVEIATEAVSVAGDSGWQ